MSKAVTAITFILTLCHCLVQGQPVYFDWLYDSGEFPSSNEGIWGGTVATQDGYMFASFAKDNSSGTSRVWLVRTDQEGDIVQTAIYGNDHESFRPQTLLSHMGGHVAVSSYVNQDSVEISSNFALIRWNQDMEVEWMRNYGTIERRESPSDAIICSDKGLLLLGQSVPIPDTEADMYVVRTDSLGNQLWTRRYGGSNYEGCQSAVETPDGGFLLLGWTRSFGAGQRDWYLIKTDSLGSQQWQRTYGDANNQSGSSIISTEDGNYLMCGGGGNGSARMIKVDIQGNIIWEEDYGHPEGTGSNYLFKVIELPDKSIVACGLTNNPTDGDAGWLVKVDSEGNELWQRKFNKNQYTDLFYSVLATEDGGFLLSGQARNAETMSQDAWLLKVDSVGCAYPNCITGIDEAEPTKVMVDVWPNPVEDMLNVEIAGSSGRLDMQVLDISGREVLRFTQYDRRATLDTGHWNSGVYILKGSDDKGRTFSMKIMKR
jgi:hypothetical protein